MGKSADNLSLLQLYRRLALFGQCDDLSKILVAVGIRGNMLASGIPR